MNWQLLLTSALISGIVSSIIALYANERMKKVEFNFDFKKYVFQKRVATYEMIETLINNFFSVGEEGGFMEWFFVPKESTKNSISSYVKQIHKILGKNVWLSEEIIPELTAVSKILDKRIEELANSEQLPVTLNDEQKQISFKFFKHQANLQKLYFVDVSKLNNVDVFLKTKNMHMDSIADNVQTLILRIERKATSNN